MKIEIDSEKVTVEELDAVVRFLTTLRLQRAGEQVVADEEEEMSEHVLSLVSEMHSFALDRGEGEEFKTAELYRVAKDQSWNDLSPNTRKAIGRQFKKFSSEHAKKAKVGDLVVDFTTRNIQNTALYEVKPKPQVEF